ncbi:hypothetical protein M9458_007572, partial [Cirrhinus mrigala]
MAIATCFALLICVLLLVFIILQHTSITANKELFKNYKDAVQVFSETNKRLQDTNSDLMTKKDQLEDRLNDLSDELNKAYKK